MSSRRRTPGRPSSPTPLPVDTIVDTVAAELARAPVVIVTAPPGSGKTTRVPPAVLRALDAGALPTEGGGQVWLVQPRRVAARLAARRIAEEWGEPPGETVGWQVRFDDRTSARTRLVAMTEGMVLRRIQADPFLEDVSVVVLDEVHERSLDLDLLVALLHDLRADARPDLRLVVMSATLDPGPLLAFFGGGTPVLHAAGRRYDVDVRYLPRASAAPLVGQVAGAVRRLLDETAPAGGHILAFLPGVGEIRRTQELLVDLTPDSTGARIEVLPLHGRLSLDAQARALAPTAHRKVVLATNIAETSVTLVGVVAVVDGGCARELRFDPSTGISHLETVEISRASADQRAGRAGRTEAGIALRLWTADQHRLRRPHDTPEIRRADLAPMWVRLLDLGTTPAALRWLEPPPAAALERAHALLRSLGVLDGAGLTPRGRALAQLPVHPRLGAVVVHGQALGGVRSAATAAAVVSEGNPWGRETDRAVDLVELVERVDRRDAGGSRRRLEAVRRVRDQLLRAVGAPRARGTLSDAELVDCVLAGFPERLARRRGAGSIRFKLASGRGAVLRRPELLPHGEFCVAVELQGRGQREDVIDLAAAIDGSAVLARAQWGVDARFDAGSQRVEVAEVATVGALEVARRPARGAVSEAVVAEVLVEAARSDPEAALALTPSAQAWLRRARFVAHHRPDLDLPDLSAAGLLAVVEVLAPGCRSFKDLRARDVLGAIQGRCTWPQRQAIDRLAPVAMVLPTGSRRTLTYGEPASAPVLAARIQQLFSWTETPRVLGGRLPVVLHLLAPNQRPAQVTSDLASFWANTWQEVRRDLRGRYPKHAWPEDPRTALPEDRPRRRRS